MIFDSHAHYDDSQFDGDREALLESLAANGIGYVVNVGADIETTKKSIELAQRYPFIYAAAGVHPSDTDKLCDEDMLWLKAQCGRRECVAVGEIGLDYYWDKDKDVRENQKKWFVRQLNLAKETGLPVIIHSRDAAKDTLDIMKAEHSEDIGGVIHCFSYSVEMAKAYLDMGFYIGVGGVVTFANAKHLKAVVEYTPIDKILLETDCPYLAPVPNRGWRNSSLNLPYVVSAIAGLKQMPEEAVIQITCENAKKMYRIS